MFKKLAFTLAEVLITLVIIGVVAAISVPSLMNNLDNNQYRSALKKNFSVFSQAFRLAYGYQFYDNYLDWDYAHANSFTQDVYQNLRQYMNINKACGRVFENNECFAPAKAKNGKPAKYFTETGFAPNFAHLYTFTLIDGTSVALDVWYKESIKQFAGVEKNLIVESDNLIILIDVNGPKGPNMVGKDVHFFVLTNKGLVPAGSDDKSKYCDNRSVNYNYDCTAEMLGRYSNKKYY